MGCSTLNELGVSEECYINLLPFRANFDQLEAKLKAFSADDYNKMTQSYLGLADKMYELASYENMFDIMLKRYS